MPSEDRIDPSANRWLERDESGRLREMSTTERVSSHISRKERATSATQAAVVQSLAAKLELDAEQLASKIPSDTLRRLKYPMIQQTDDEGRTVYKHDIGIVADSRIGLTGVDRAHEAIPKGDHARGAGVPQLRDTGGKFIK